MSEQGPDARPEASPEDSGGIVKPALARFFWETWEFVKIILIAFLIAVPIRYFIAQPFIVRGDSMVPNFHNGDYLVIDELSYYVRDPGRGEVVVFRYPLDPKQFFIKRIIGLPGEKIEVQDGKVMITPVTGEPFMLSEDYLPGNLLTGNARTVQLEDGQYFVLGDNRPFSSDSRVWGVLQRNFITGRALIRAWPPGVAGLVPQAAY